MARLAAVAAADRKVDTVPRYAEVSGLKLPFARIKCNGAVTGVLAIPLLHCATTHAITRLVEVKIDGVIDAEIIDPEFSKHPTLAAMTGLDVEVGATVGASGHTMTVLRGDMNATISLGSGDR
jgi:hypothetical protein